MHYESSVRFLGFPLVHIASGPRVGRVVSIAPGLMSRGVARGWIAIGDVAFGLIAIGGVAVGGLSVGGVAVGALSIGGFAIGVAGIGGAAVALLAVGGMALGGWAAVGGLAVARDVAIGGVALARSANDSTASAYIDSNLFFRIASWVNFHAITLAFLPMMVVFLLVIGKILRGSTDRDPPQIR